MRRSTQESPPAAPTPVPPRAAGRNRIRLSPVGRSASVDKTDGGTACTCSLSNISRRLKNHQGARENFSNGNRKAAKLLKQTRRATSVPNPKFASFFSECLCELRVGKDT